MNNENNLETQQSEIPTIHNDESRQEIVGPSSINQKNSMKPQIEIDDEEQMEDVDLNHQKPLFAINSEPEEMRVKPEKPEP